MSKYYKFLNKKNLSELKSEDLLFRVNNFGKKFILFLTRFNNKNYSIFINSKTYVMTMSKFRFVNELFDGTLLIGSYLKKDNNKWSYLVNDIYYYKNKDIITKSFNDRYKIMEHLINNEFENDEHLSCCNIELSKYYELKYMKYVNNNLESLYNYKVSGLYFKNINNFSNNYLYVFLKCRSDYKLKHNIKEGKLTKIFKDTSKNDIKIDKEEIRDYVVMGIKPTVLPDVYNLYHMNSNNYEINSCASVQSDKICKYLRKIFKKKEVDMDDELSSESEISDGEELDMLKVRCKYNINFKSLRKIKLKMNLLI